MFFSSVTFGNCVCGAPNVNLFGVMMVTLFVYPHRPFSSRRRLIFLLELQCAVDVSRTSTRTLYSECAVLDAYRKSRPWVTIFFLKLEDLKFILSMRHVLSIKSSSCPWKAPVRSKVQVEGKAPTGLRGCAHAARSSWCGQRNKIVGFGATSSCGTLQKLNFLALSLSIPYFGERYGTSHI